MSQTFEGMLVQLREGTALEKGVKFEEVMRQYFLQDMKYKTRFSEVWLWRDQENPRRDGRDIGIDLVAKDTQRGGYCAIQCKCYAADITVTKQDIDSFLSASGSKEYTSRILVHTGKGLASNARRAIKDQRLECSILTSFELSASSIDWSDLSQLLVRRELYELRPHQQQAIDDVRKGFQHADRGKLIMACGTGKTFTSLRLAEEMAGLGGYVLYLLPSISLLTQIIREWSTQQGLVHRYIVVCSDKTTAKDEDTDRSAIEIPVTTDVNTLIQELRHTSSESMTVVFSTYQSIDVVVSAQESGTPWFDLVICDEAHRTTGIEESNKKTSPFLRIHDPVAIRATKRLYMTATPRIYADTSRKKAKELNIRLFSMDDEKTYGPEFHRLGFGRAIERELLSDYRVIVLHISENYAAHVLRIMLERELYHQPDLSDTAYPLSLADVANMIGCWKGLMYPRARRAVSFTNTISNSVHIKKYFPAIVAGAQEASPGEDIFRCEVQHVDGTYSAQKRAAALDWLRQWNDSQTCRLLSNARCLSEGIDVPALDAILFMNPRNSQVDVVQAVGRVMRKAAHKDYGYIILPILIPPDKQAEDVLDNNEAYKTVWSVLRALRSHDERFNAIVNQITLNRAPPENVEFIGVADDGKILDRYQLKFFLPFPPEAIEAKLVEKVGDRAYWEDWAKDIAEIAGHNVTRIKGLIKDRQAAMLFHEFHDSLQQMINDSITKDDAINMLSQHMITKPVFDALFEKYAFSEHNPISQQMQTMYDLLIEHGLHSEVRDLEGFYDSVRARVKGIDNPAGRQEVIKELYQKFFQTALKKDSDRLGIVYTPNEIIDFILHSADAVLRQEFSCGLTEENVHILDPFTGTGSFITRLLQSELIDPSDLDRKFMHELHANECVLLAYYIAAVNIEEAYHGCKPPETDYQPFNGIVLCDTFNLAERDDTFKGLFPENDARVASQKKRQIRVIIGNPPYSAGQKSGNDENPNVKYAVLDERIKQTYVKHSVMQNNNSLYDSYIRALRWASDRLDPEGIIAFVTNGSFMTSNVASGIRACLNKEFSAVYCLDLRGNQRTQGERSRREGGKVFGSGSRASVAITILVKKPRDHQTPCHIYYKDIGDYLSRAEKLQRIKDYASVTGIQDWQTIIPDCHNDWIDQRDNRFQTFMPLGIKEDKQTTQGEAIFHQYCCGLTTGRDAWVYNSSRAKLASTMEGMIDFYNDHLTNRREPEYDKRRIKWDRELEQHLKSGHYGRFDPAKIRVSLYRPFFKQCVYMDRQFNNCVYRLPHFFPSADTKNPTICVMGVGSTKPFSVIATDILPDLSVVDKSQCFPRYTYEEAGSFFTRSDSPPPVLTRIDNIRDTTLQRYHSYYDDTSITKDDIFHYVYGLLHSPEYRLRYQANFARELPRIPFALDFRTFADIGKQLLDLHLNYEQLEGYRLHCRHLPGFNPRDYAHMRIEKIRYAKSEDKKSDKTCLILNHYTYLTGIPREVEDYVVNGRNLVGWLMDRYQVRRDSESGIENDVNDWFPDIDAFISHVERVIEVSVKTVSLVNSLPNPFPEDKE